MLYFSQFLVSLLRGYGGLNAECLLTASQTFGLQLVVLSGASSNLFRGSVLLEEVNHWGLVQTAPLPIFFLFPVGGWKCTEPASCSWGRWRASPAITDSSPLELYAKTNPFSLKFHCHGILSQQQESHQYRAFLYGDKFTYSEL